MQVPPKTFIILYEFGGTLLQNGIA